MRISNNCKAGGAAFAVLLTTASFTGAAAPAQAQSLIPGVTGCGAPGEKQVGGAVLGALAGGLLGNSVSGHNRTTGTLLGAAVGGAAGSAVGCQMQHNAQDRAAQAQAQTQAQAQAEAQSQAQQGYGARTYQRDGYELSSQIAPASYEDLDEDTLVTTRTLTLRAAPENGGARVGKLRRGERFDALAQVRGTDWVLVGRDGVGVGYVQKAYTRADSPRYAGR